MVTLNLQSLLIQLLVVLGLGIGVIAFFRRLKLPTIWGYLAVGFTLQLLGTEMFYAFNQLQFLAHYGVVFLLFTIGLEFSIERLIAMRKIVFVIGGLQVFITTLVFWPLLLLCKIPTTMSLMLAAAFALSSTALISKYLSEVGQLQTTVGYTSIAILIFQDIMVVPLIIFTKALGSDAGTHFELWHLLIELLKGLLTFLIIVLSSKYLFSTLLHEVAKARSREVFLLSVLFIVMCAATVSEAMGMSMELGAFLAGAMLGSSPYHHQVETEIRPFRDVLLGLFFVGVGALINPHLLGETISAMLLAALIILGLKAVILTLICRYLNQNNWATAIKIGLLLAQASEFGFVLIAAASHYELISSPVDQIALGAIIISMVLSTLLNQADNLWLPWLNRLTQIALPTPNIPQDEQHEVLIVGYGRVGQQLAKMISPQGYRFIALDLDPTRIQQAQLAGLPVMYGDATDEHILHKACIAQVKLIVITCADSHMAKKITQHVRSARPDAPILVRTKDEQMNDALRHAGATEIISESLEASITLGAHTLITLGEKHTSVSAWCQAIRTNQYRMLSGYIPGDADNLNESESLTRGPQQQALKIHANSLLSGKTIQELKQQFPGVTVTGFRRHGIFCEAPTANTALQAEDIITFHAERELHAALSLQALPRAN